MKERLDRSVIALRLQLLQREGYCCIESVVSHGMMVLYYAKAGYPSLCVRYSSNGWYSCDIV